MLLNSPKRPFQAHSQLFFQGEGDPSDAFYIVCKGLVGIEDSKGTQDRAFFMLTPEAIALIRVLFSPFL